MFCRIAKQWILYYKLCNLRVFLLRKCKQIRGFFCCFPDVPNLQMNYWFRTVSTTEVVARKMGTLHFVIFIPVVCRTSRAKKSIYQTRRKYRISRVRAGLTFIMIIEQKFRMTQFNVCIVKVDLQQKATRRKISLAFFARDRRERSKSRKFKSFILGRTQITTEIDRNVNDKCILSFLLICFRVLKLKTFESEISTFYEIAYDWKIKVWYLFRKWFHRVCISPVQTV